MFHERSDRPEYRGVGDEHVNGAVELGHAIDGGRELLEIPHVGAKAMRGSAGMFNFQFGEVEFALAAAEESDAEPGAGETYRQALSDSPPGAGDQRRFCTCWSDCKWVFYRQRGVDNSGPNWPPERIGTQGWWRCGYQPRSSIFLRIPPASSPGVSPAHFPCNG